MPPAIDIEAYFARVGHAGPRAATLETARELRLRHVQAIPFENLDPVLARPVRLDLPALEQNLIRDGRAANCEADARERLRKYAPYWKQTSLLRFPTPPGSKRQLRGSSTPTSEMDTSRVIYPA